MSDYTITPVTREDCKPFILDIHYAKRWPSVSFRYGLFKGEELVGVVTYGTPASSGLRSGIAGDTHKGEVLELNRLCLKYNVKNEASMLVAKSLTMLPKGRIIVSFADKSQGHVGYVYQACNFTYHGLSAKRTDWKVKGKEHLHGMTIADEFRGVANRSQALRDKYGDDFYTTPRPRKHRYIFIVGSKTYKRSVTKSIKYKQEPYPKGEAA